MWDLGSTLYYTIKVSAVIFVCSAFLLGINALIGLLGSWINTTFMGEFFNMVSMYLPFNASSVFSAILLSCVGIFTFKVSKKVFDLASWGINSA